MSGAPRRGALAWRLLVVLASLALVTWWLLRPICVPLLEADVRAMAPPIATRADRDFHVRVFQQRDGRWHQCRTWISRRLFF